MEILLLKASNHLRLGLDLAFLLYPSLYTMKKPVTRLQSISLEGKESEGFVSPANVVPITHKSLIEAFHLNLIRCSPAHTWPGNAYLSASPHPILITEKHQRQLAELNDALFLAISDIVERWWIDSEARFPERMPVGPAEEKILQVSTFHRVSST